MMEDLIDLAPESVNVNLQNGSIGVAESIEDLLKTEDTELVSIENEVELKPFTDLQHELPSLPNCNQNPSELPSISLENLNKLPTEPIYANLHETQEEIRTLISNSFCLDTEVEDTTIKDTEIKKDAEECEDLADNSIDPEIFEERTTLMSYLKRIFRSQTKNNRSSTFYLPFPNSEILNTIDEATGGSIEYRVLDIQQPKLPHGFWKKLFFRQRSNQDTGLDKVATAKLLEGIESTLNEFEVYKRENNLSTDLEPSQESLFKKFWRPLSFKSSGSTIKNVNQSSELVELEKPIVFGKGDSAHSSSDPEPSTSRMHFKASAPAQKDSPPSYDSVLMAEQQKRLIEEMLLLDDNDLIDCKDSGERSEHAINSQPISFVESSILLPEPASKASEMGTAKRSLFDSFAKSVLREFDPNNEQYMEIFFAQNPSHLVWVQTFCDDMKILDLK